MVLPPRFNFVLCVLKAYKPVLVQALMESPPVEALDRRVIGRLA